MLETGAHNPPRFVRVGRVCRLLVRSLGGRAFPLRGSWSSLPGVLVRPLFGRAWPLRFWLWLLVQVLGFPGVFSSSSSLRSLRLGVCFGVLRVFFLNSLMQNFCVLSPSLTTMLHASTPNPPFASSSSSVQTMSQDFGFLCWVSSTCTFIGCTTVCVWRSPVFCVALMG